jgi:hypothetical protein
MANKNFVVHNGLTVGPLTIDAATGDINTSGNVNITGNLGVSQISKNDSSVSITDTGTGSSVSINIDGTTEHTVDADGVSIASGDRYAIGGTSVLNATTLGSAVVNSSLTTVGNLTALSVAGSATVYGNLTVQGLATLNGGTLTLGDANTDNVVFGAEINSNVNPNTTATYDLGTDGLRWNTLFSQTANIAGNVTATNLTATNLTGTLLTTSQTNVTTVGNLTAITVGGSTSLVGVVYANADSTSTSTTSGALRVKGGVGVTGNISAGGQITIAGAVAATQADATALAIALG